MRKKIIFVALLLFSTSLHAGLTVCNRYTCSSEKLYDSQEILNAMAQVFSGKQKEFLLCEADKDDKTCRNQPITFSGRTNLMAVQFRIPFVRIMQLYLEKGFIRMVLDYQIQANEYYPVCHSSNSMLSFSMSNDGDFLLNSPDFNCRVTELGETKVGISFTLDYIDLDKGYLGGTYQTIVKGDVLGGGTGYAMLKLSNQRSIQIPRLVPTDFTSDDGYSVSVDRSGNYQGRPGKRGRLLDWDLDNIKKKWNSFSEKFMKILYLEPLE